MSDFNQLAAIDAIVMDVDGVLTDGSFYWSTSGEEIKRFSFEDVMGLSRARQAGLVLGIISGEESPLIDRLAAKVGIIYVWKGCKEKARALRSFAAATNIAMSRIAFVGDDINDLPAFAVAGLGVAPANAQPSVKAASSFVLSKCGGCGAIRELLEAIIAARQTGVS